jgi:hypothetical protein
MTHQATVPSGFMVSPPLDYPLRLRAPNGRWGMARVMGPAPAATCGSDHFASVNPDGVPGLHRIHEAVDLASGEGNCVFAAYAGTIVEKTPAHLTITHHDGGAAFATQYLHIVPGPKVVGDRVVTGEPIASVDHDDAGDHLHFELWHWVSSPPTPNLPMKAVPVDPTRLLYRWEVELELDYAVLGIIDLSFSADLDAGTWSAALQDAYAAAGFPGFTTPAITVLAAGAVWRIAEAPTTHLLRKEGPWITVIDEAYRTRVVPAAVPDRIGIQRRLGFPVFLVQTGDATYAVPLHQAPAEDRAMVALLEEAFKAATPVELDVRRSAFWAMDGSADSVAGVIEGARLG